MTVSDRCMDHDRGASRSGLLLLLVVAALGLIGLIWAISGRDESGPAASAPVPEELGPAIAVLPFRLAGEGVEEVWEVGMAELVSTVLDGVDGIRPVDTGIVVRHWGGGGAEAPTVLVGAGADFAVEGSLTPAGETVHVEARVLDLQTGGPVGTPVEVEGSFDDPHDLVDRTSLAILETLVAAGAVTESGPADLAAVSTSDEGALRSYLRAEGFYREDRWAESIREYQAAVDADSTFALAWFRMSMAGGWTNALPPDSQNRARAWARQFSERLPARERLLAEGYLRMTPIQAEDPAQPNPLEVAVRSYPEDPEVLYHFAETLIHQDDRPVSAWDLEALFGRAIELDPDFAPFRVHHVELAFNLRGDPELAATRAAEYRDLTAGSDTARVAATDRALRLAWGPDPTRSALMDSVSTLSSEAVGGIADYLLHSSNLDKAETLLRELLSRPESAELEGAGWLIFLGRALAWQGRSAEALEVLETPVLEMISATGCMAVDYLMSGVLVPEVLLLELAVQGGRAGATLPEALCGMVIAADLGLRDEMALARRRLVLPAALEAGGDILLRQLDLYGEWKLDGGDPAELADELRSMGGTRNWPLWVLWLGELSFEAGRFEDAETAYLSAQTLGFGSNNLTTSWVRLAEIYREQGDAARERDALERIVAAWENADPEFQPRVEEARARLAALN